MEDEARMAPGYRFYPTEEALVGFYLREKLQGRRNHQLQHLIPLLDIYDYSPVRGICQLSGRQDPQVQEWFFFIPRQEKEARGGRPNRLTSTGYWKATGSPSNVYSSSNRRIIGEKRTMVFYKGRAPGTNTHWKMNEYRAIDHAHANDNLVIKLDFSLCRVYVRSKCVRSYDRRPSSSAPSSSPSPSPSSPSPSTTVDHQQNPPLLIVYGETSGSSTENLSYSADQSAYNNCCSNNLHISDMDVNMGDEPLWKWEQLLNSTEWMII